VPPDLDFSVEMSSYELLPGMTSNYDPPDLHFLSY
jgi:hypothetical protein